MSSINLPVISFTQKLCIMGVELVKQVFPLIAAGVSMEHHGVQPTAWTTNLSLHVTSHVKAFPGRQTKFDSTLVRAAHLESDMIMCYQCLHLALGMRSGIFRHATKPSWICPACLPTITSTPAPPNTP